MSQGKKKIMFSYSEAPKETRWHSDQSRLVHDRLYMIAQRTSPCCVTCIVVAAVIVLLLSSNADTVFSPAHRGRSFSALSSALDSSSNTAHRSGSASQDRLCRKYSVALYDDETAAVCDPRICSGRDSLHTLQKLPRIRRWSSTKEGHYMKLHSTNKISGWVQAPQLDYVKSFTLKQHELGIYGAVGEIGVHHGKFLIPLVGNALVDEPAVAIDLFEDQESNVDKSGSGNKAALLKNLDACGIPEKTVKLLSGNSMHLSAQNFSSMNWPAFRMLSIDGGHTLEITLHDLMLASCVIRDGGLVVVDDFPSSTWFGVTEAIVHFSHAQDRLVPFLHGYNKIWLTTSSHVQQYQEFVSSQTKVFGCKDMHESRRVIGGHALCYTGPAPV